MLEELSPPLVITNCTTRKRAASAAVRLPKVARRESLSDLAGRWARLVATARSRVPAGELYVGRAMAEAKIVSGKLGAELCIVSAGLGLVHERRMVPNYDVSASERQSTLACALRERCSDMSEWWLHITRSLSGQSIGDMACGQPGRLIFIALPATYLRLVRRDLTSIQPAFARSIRILTSEAGATEVPRHLADCVLPYTEQLESIDGFDGTRAEFPQRALRHFVVALGGHRLSLPRAHAVVRESLSRFDVRHIPRRERKTDQEIAELIKAGWVQCDGSSTKLHRYLRDDLAVACEQARFRGIWRGVRAELAASGA